MDVDSDSDDIHKDGELDDAIINIHLNYASALSDAGMAFAAKSILENMLGKIKRANMAYTSTAPAVKGHEECSQDDEEPKLKQLENLRDHVLIRIKKMDH
jgi:L-cysteine desulfidase